MIRRWQVSLLLAAAAGGFLVLAVRVALAEVAYCAAGENLLCFSGFRTEFSWGVESSLLASGGVAAGVGAVLMWRHSRR